jgi:hypothetical protein
VTAVVQLQRSRKARRVKALLLLRRSAYAAIPRFEARDAHRQNPSSG